MRIISQNEIYDLPYDKCFVCLNKNNVMASPIGEPESDYTMAIYSKPEKAEKAMKLMHETYSGMPVIFQNIGVEEDYLSKFKEDFKGCILTKIPNEPSKVEYINKTVFQFPKEEYL